MFKQVLAIDPGITTGYALVSRTGEYLESGNLDIEDLLTGDTYLEKFVEPNQTTLVVIEEIPQFFNSALGRDLKKVIAYLTSLFPQAIWVRPTEWKSIPPIANYPLPKNADFSVHQKDAFRIGIYYVTRRGVLHGISHK